MKRVTKESWLCERPIAHRGLHSGAVPENSFPAFARAIEKNYPIELDVHLLKSGEIVVFHDENLKRLTGRGASVKDSRLEDIRDLRLAGTNERIPLLGEVLALVAGKVPLIIELKSTAAPKRIGRALMRVLSDYEGDYVVQSYNPLILRWFTKHAPAVIRGHLSGREDARTKNPVKRLLFGRLRFSFLSRPDYILYDIDALKPKKVRKYLEKGYTLLGFTARDEAAYQDHSPLFDNLVFEGFTPLETE